MLMQVAQYASQEVARSKQTMLARSGSFSRLRCLLLTVLAALPRRCWSSLSPFLPLSHPPPSRTLRPHPMAARSGRCPRLRIGLLLETPAALLRWHWPARFADESLVLVLQVSRPEFGTSLALATIVAYKFFLVDFCLDGRFSLAWLQRLACLAQDAHPTIPPVVFPELAPGLRC